MSQTKKFIILFLIIISIVLNDSIYSLLSCKRKYKPITDKNVKRAVIRKVVEGKFIYLGLYNEKTFYATVSDSGRKYDVIFTSKKPIRLNIGDSVDITLKK